MSSSQGFQFINDGGWYEGEYKDEKYHGHGTETWSDGDKYEGEFKDGKRNGHGTYTWSDGGKYVGKFKDGEYHGNGKVKEHSPYLMERSMWVNSRMGKTMVKEPSLSLME